jgi:hypothetical protein
LSLLRRAALALGLGLLAGLALPAHAEALRYCDQHGEMSHEQRDRLFRFAALVRDELEASGQRLALVSRSGLDLARFGQRYSHTGVSLKGSEVAPWSVRQLYYACEERQPRLFDQGLTAFLLGLNNPQGGYISVVFLPEAAAATLEPAALDNRRALQLLGATYSANAYAYGLRYQNCNQWVMEMLASAWSDAPQAEEARVRAQDWMRAQGYAAGQLRRASETCAPRCGSSAARSPAAAASRAAAAPPWPAPSRTAPSPRSAARVRLRAARCSRLAAAFRAAGAASGRCA